MMNEKCDGVLFILIDDDEINNMISRLTIENACTNGAIATFRDPVDALNFVQNDFEDIQEYQEIIILLDIHMPTMSGWEFMQRFESLNDEIKSHLKVYVLSSSLDKRDEDMSRTNKYVREFISKPLTTEVVIRLCASGDQ